MGVRGPAARIGRDQAVEPALLDRLELGPLEHGLEGEPEGVEVGSGVGAVTLDHLRGREGRSADRPRRTPDRAGTAEVDQGVAAVRTAQHVAGRDVAVAKARRVERSERAEHLSDAFSEIVKAAGGELGPRRALHVRGAEIGPAGALKLDETEVVDPPERRVVDGSEHLELRGQRSLVTPSDEKLERDGPLEREIVGEKRRTEATLAERPLESVAARENL